MPGFDQDIILLIRGGVHDIPLQARDPFDDSPFGVGRWSQDNHIPSLHLKIFHGPNIQKHMIRAFVAVL